MPKRKKTKTVKSKPKLTAEQVRDFLKPWKEKLETTRRDVLLIRLRKGKDDLRASKVGGKPYVPAGETLPSNAAGDPMLLLAQINFAYAPKIPGAPSSGLLQFFISADEFYGASFDGSFRETSLSAQKNFRIIYRSRISKSPAKIPYPPVHCDPRALPFDPAVSLGMSFEPATETVSPEDVGFNRVFGKGLFDLASELAAAYGADEDSAYHALNDVLMPHGSCHKLGGYPDFTQFDPRSSRSKKRLLFQLCSEYDGKIDLMWGDCGIGAFFIDPEKLRERDFSDVMYNWDCC